MLSVANYMRQFHALIVPFLIMIFTIFHKIHIQTPPSPPTQNHIHTILPCIQTTHTYTLTQSLPKQQEQRFYKMYGRYRLNEFD